MGIKLPRVKSASPKILLCGYFGYDNAGDEALFEAAVLTLRALDPQVRLAALVHHTQNALRLDVEPIPRFHLPSVWKALRSADLFLQGGGGLLQDTTGPRSVIYYGGLLLLSGLARCPSMVLSQGFGPVRRSWLRVLCSRLLRIPKIVTLRDQESVDELVGLGLSRSGLHLSADPALLLEPEDPANFSTFLKSHGLSSEVGRSELPDGRLASTGPLVAVSLRGVPGFKLDVFAQALKSFRQNHKARYLLIPFMPEQDLPICEDLKELLDGEAFLFRESLPPRRLTALLACCDMIIGMRLHSLILGTIGSSPMFGLSYDPKVERFCRRAGALSCSIEEISQDRLLQAWEHLLHGRKSQRAVQEGRVSGLKDQALGAFEAALELARGTPASEVGLETEAKRSG